jgi:hypothetical protein
VIRTPLPNLDLLQLGGPRFFDILRLSVSGNKQDLDLNFSVLEGNIAGVHTPGFAFATSITLFHQMMTTNDGYPRYAISTIRPGDQVFIVEGAPTPYVSLPVTGSGVRTEYELIGEAFIYGLMDGEALG